MKQVVWVSVAATLALSACAGAPPLDYSKVDAECAQKCKTSETECTSRFAEFPTLLYTHCAPEARACVKACPPPGSSPAKLNTTDKPADTLSKIPANSNSATSIADRLKLLEELHKSGVITDKEYTDKRQEILKSL
jgi:hypothetical protein